MKRNLVLLICLLSVLSISSCYYDVEEDLYPLNGGGTGCDTSAVTYALKVKPIIDQNCINCHNQASQQGNVVLETHPDIVTYANSGQLLGAIKHQPGFSPMPKSGTKLNDCSILIIEKWVQSGSPNN